MEPSTHHKSVSTADIAEGHHPIAGDQNLPPAEEAFGTWMIAMRLNKARSPKTPSPLGGTSDQSKGQKAVRDHRNGKSTSRFSVLADLDREENETFEGYEVDIHKGGPAVQGTAGEQCQSTPSMEGVHPADFKQRQQKKDNALNAQQKALGGTKISGKENKNPNGPKQKGKAQWEPKGVVSGPPDSGMVAREQAHRKPNQKRDHIIVLGSSSHTASTSIVDPPQLMPPPNGGVILLDGSQQPPPSPSMGLVPFHPRPPEAGLSAAELEVSEDVEMTSAGEMPKTTLRGDATRWEEDDPLD